MSKWILLVLVYLLSTPISAQTVVGDRFRLNVGPCTHRSGVGSPEGVIIGRPCDTYLNTADGVFWEKWTGLNTNVGWNVGFNRDARINGNVNITGFIGEPSFVSQVAKWRIDNTGGADFRYIYADELHAKSFIADQEQALAGGQIISKSVAVLSAPFTCPLSNGAATITIEDLPGAPGMQVFQASDYVVVRSFVRAGGALTIGDCVGVVSSPNTPGGTQSWTFTRGTGAAGGAMTANTVIPARNLALDYGVSGNGYYEVNAIDGAYGLNSPYAQTVTWATSPIAANRTLRTRIGNLRGITGSTEYGAILGTYGTGAAQYIRASDVAFEIHNINLSMYSGATEVFRLDRTAPSLAIGAAVPSAYGTGTGIWMGNDSGTYKFRVGNPAGNRLTWDGTTLSVVGDGGGVTNINGANIQTGTVTATQIAALTITASQIAASTITAAKLNVTSLSAISANIGTITAGSISGTTFTAGNGLTIDSNGIVMNSGCSLCGYRFSDSTGMFRDNISSHLSFAGGTGIDLSSSGGTAITNGIALLSGNLAFSGNGNITGLHDITSDGQFKGTNSIYAGSGNRNLCVANDGAFYRATGTAPGVC